MAGKRTQRALLVLGSVLALDLVGVVVSGSYLKWLYRPTEAQAWSDISTLQTHITTGRLARAVHRLLGNLVALGLPIYAVIFAVAGMRQAMIVRRRLWAAALFAIVIGLIGPPIVMASMRVSVSLRSWYLVHEAPAYLLLPALVLAIVARTRARGNEPPTT